MNSGASITKRTVADVAAFLGAIFCSWFSTDWSFSHHPKDSLFGRFEATTKRLKRFQSLKCFFNFSMFFRVSSSTLGTSNFVSFFRSCACWIIFLKQYIYMNSTLASPPIAWHLVRFYPYFFLDKNKGNLWKFGSPPVLFSFSPPKKMNRENVYTTEIHQKGRRKRLLFPGSWLDARTANGCLPVFPIRTTPRPASSVVASAVPWVASAVPPSRRRSASEFRKKGRAL